MDRKRAYEKYVKQQSAFLCFNCNSDTTCTDRNAHIVSILRTMRNPPGAEEKIVLKKYCNS